MAESKVWFDGRWLYDPSGWWKYLRPGYYDPAAVPAAEDFQHTVGLREMLQLIPRLDEEGFIKPRLDERLRSEDLKITHRLLDIIQVQLHTK